MNLVFGIIFIYQTGFVVNVYEPAWMFLPEGTVREKTIEMRGVYMP